MQLIDEEGETLFSHIFFGRPEVEQIGAVWNDEVIGNRRILLIEITSIPE